MLVRRGGEQQGEDVLPKEASRMGPVRERLGDCSEKYKPQARNPPSPTKLRQENCLSPGVPDCGKGMAFPYHVCHLGQFKIKSKLLLPNLGTWCLPLLWAICLGKETSCYLGGGLKSVKSQEEEQCFG